MESQNGGAVLKSRRKNGDAHANRIAELEKPPKTERIAISRPEFKTISVKIVGTAPYLQCRFSKKSFDQMRDTQELGDADKKKSTRKRKPRDFKSEFQDSLHKMKGGGYGIPASAFLSAMTSACILLDVSKPTMKKCVQILPDGQDAEDDQSLVRIDGKPEAHEMIGRNSDMKRGANIRVRGIFRKWSAVVRVRYESTIFSATDIINLLYRVGTQIGVGEGRPDSRNSVGMGLGTFDVKPI